MREILARQCVRPKPLINFLECFFRNEAKTWGNAKVTLLSARQPDPAFWERLLRVEINGKAHHVVQFQFILWPDFSTPDDRNIQQVLQYLARVKKISREGNYNGVPLNTVSFTLP